MLGSMFPPREILMALLPTDEIGSELSYTCLHAVAAKPGMECRVVGRHSDKLGIDATITAKDTFGPGTVATISV